MSCHSILDYSVFNCIVIYVYCILLYYSKGYCLKVYDSSSERVLAARKRSFQKLPSLVEVFMDIFGMMITCCIGALILDYVH